MEASECWEWPKRKRNGYGVATITIAGKKWPIAIHRFAYSTTYGPIPSGMVVMHTCDNRSCYNPEHLWLGTQAENMRDMFQKGRENPWNRGKSACIRGHEFTDENTYVPPGRSMRQCRICKREAKRRLRLKERAK